MYVLTTIIFSVFILSIATATVSVYTVEFGQPNKNNFKVFALSVASATVSVDTLLFYVYIYNYQFLCVYSANRKHVENDSF